MVLNIGNMTTFMECFLHSWHLSCQVSLHCIDQCPVSWEFVVATGALQVTGLYSLDHTRWVTPHHTTPKHTTPHHTTLHYTGPYSLYHNMCVTGLSDIVVL